VVIELRVSLALVLISVVGRAVYVNVSPSLRHVPLADLDCGLGEIRGLENKNLH
jgi:hypothetical protein